MTPRLETIHKKNALILALAVLGSILYGIAAVGSVALGGGIQVLNLFALDRTLSSLRGLAGSGSGRGLRAVLAFRFLAVVALAGWALVTLAVEPLPFVIGLGTVIPAALWHGLQPSRQPGVRGT